MNLKKRSLALLLCLALVVGLFAGLTVTASAAADYGVNAITATQVTSSTLTVGNVYAIVAKETATKYYVAKNDATTATSATLSGGTLTLSSGTFTDYAWTYTASGTLHNDSANVDLTFTGYGASTTSGAGAGSVVTYNTDGDLINASGNHYGTNYACSAFMGLLNKSSGATTLLYDITLADSGSGESGGESGNDGDGITALSVELVSTDNYSDGDLLIFAKDSVGRAATGTTTTGSYTGLAAVAFSVVVDEITTPAAVSDQLDLLWEYHTDGTNEYIQNYKTGEYLVLGNGSYNKAETSSTKTAIYTIDEDTVGSKYSGGSTTVYLGYYASDNSFYSTYSFGQYGLNIYKVTPSYEPVVVCAHEHVTAYPAVAATCTTAGNSAYWYCADCGRYFDDAACTHRIAADSWVIAATGEHNYVNGVCTVCGQDEPTDVVLGASGSQGLYYSPYYNYTAKSTVQTIYLASEIGRAGTIESVAYKVSTASSYTMSSLKIYMGHTSLEKFSSGSAALTSGLNLVYDGTNVTVGGSTGWEDAITLDTPFEYNGTDNLVIVVCNQGTSNSTLRYTTYYGTSYSTIYRGHSSTSAYADMSYGHSSYNYSTSGYKPTMTLNFKSNKQASHTHSYGDPAWSWTGTSSAKATFICTDNDDTQTVNATITSKVTKAATCAAAGETTYTATVSFGGKTYTDTTTETIAKLTTHTYSTAVYAGNHQHTATCTVCNQPVTEACVDANNDGVCDYCGAGMGGTPTITTSQECTDHVTGETPGGTTYSEYTNASSFNTSYYYAIKVKNNAYSGNVTYYLSAEGATTSSTTMKASSSLNKYTVWKPVASGSGYALHNEETDTYLYSANAGSLRISTSAIQYVEINSNNLKMNGTSKYVIFDNSNSSNYYFTTQSSAPGGANVVALNRLSVSTSEATKTYGPHEASATLKGALDPVDATHPGYTGDTVCAHCGKLLAAGEDVAYVAKYDVTVGTIDGGTVTADKASAAAGETITLTVTPDAGYKLLTLTVRNAEGQLETTKVDDTTYTFTMPAEDVRVGADFQRITYTITWSVDGKTSTTSVNHGATPSYSGTPTKAADAQYTYTFREWTPAITAATANATYTAVFDQAKVQYAVSVSGTTGGSVSPNAGSVAWGETVTLTVTLADGYELDTLTVTDASGNAIAVTDNSFTMPTAAVTVSATFKQSVVITIDDSESGAKEITVDNKTLTVESTGKGEGKTTTAATAENGTLTIAMTPAGAETAAVTLRCESYGAAEQNTFTVTMPEESKTVAVVLVLNDGKYEKAEIKTEGGTHTVTLDADATVVLAVKGDANGDGKIDVGDLSMMYGAMLGDAAALNNLGEIGGLTAKIAGKGSIGIVDILAVLTVFKGLASLSW